MKSLTVAVSYLMIGAVWTELCSKMCDKNTVSQTTTGVPCQRWDSQTPHKHQFTTLGDQDNYCRNPDGEAGPWCYTTDPKKRWELCCDCKTTNKGTEYKGKAVTTINGAACQRWDSQAPHKHGFGSLADQENYCRNPDKTAVGPWCYTTGTRRWDECDVPFCSDDYMNKAGE